MSERRFITFGCMCCAGGVPLPGKLSCVARFLASQFYGFRGSFLGGSLAIDGGTVKVAYPEDKREAVKPIISGLRAHREEVVQILAGGPAKGSVRLGVDPYWQRADKALKRICVRPYLPGAIQWLKRANPVLHRILTQDLLRQIDKLWDVRAPLDEFQAVLDKWVEVHAHVVKLYERRDAAGNG